MSKRLLFKCMSQTKSLTLFLICTTWITSLANAQTPIFSPGMTITCLNGCNSGGDIVDNVIDGSYATKFLDFNQVNTGFTVNTNVAAVVTNRIDLTTGNDAANRDPRDYTLEGSNDGSSWTTITSGSLPCVAARGYTHSYTFSNATAYSWYRVSFSTVCDALNSNSMQIAEVQLYSGVLLPIKLISFSSQLKNENAELKWSIAEAEEEAEYNLQRSTDGRSFYSINIQRGNMHSTSFNYTDQSVKNGTTYYRLKMTDKEGKITYSNIALVKQGGKGVSVVVYPNPVQKAGSVQISTDNATLESWKLINAFGTTLVQKNNIRVNGSVTVQLPASLTPGVYYFQFITDKGTHSERIIVQ